MSLQSSTSLPNRKWKVESEEETLFSAMKCSAEDIKLCALEEVVIDEMCYTIGYLHTKEHNETVVILLDETFSEPPSFILLLIDVFTHLHLFPWRPKRAQYECCDLHHDFGHSILPLKRFRVVTFFRKCGERF